VSLVLATYGRCDDVARLFDSLAQQTDPHFEVLVVDQNTDDRLFPIIEQGRVLGLTIRHIKMDRPSLSGARNRGIAEAHGEIVAFPDDDCWYEPDTIATLRAAFFATPDINGVVGCWVESNRHTGATIIPEALTYASWRAFRGDNASSICLFFKRDLFKRIGGFDERLGVGCWFGAGEETDLLLRALAAGALLIRQPQVRVHHAFSLPGGGTLWGKQWAAVRSRTRGTGALFAKHRLDLWVVFRGLLAPIVMPLLRGEGLRSAGLGVANSIGKLEGMLRWGWGRP
jgi:GT2 family glycosyltransferase